MAELCQAAGYALAGKMVAMSRGLTDQFSHLIPPTAEDQHEAISAGMVTVDASVLLTLYLYGAQARADFISALTMLGNRLWLSHQAALEFHHNRLLIMQDQGRSYSEMLATLQAYRAETQKLDLRVREFSNRTGMMSADRDRLLGFLTPSVAAALRMVEELKSDQEELGPTDPDPVLRQLESVFDGKVGGPLEEAAYENSVLEAERRIQHRVPPGYKDAGKGNSAGDYLQWEQTLIEVAKRKPKYLLCVTRDQKDDWLLRVRGKTFGPRPELALEAQQRAGCRLVIINPGHFLVLASTYLNTTISEATLEEGVRVADRVQELQERLGRVSGED
ncbi:PIN-like domain-containing protein [Micromonospora taraxaci]|uniref:PIN-like domain-containing protein n=1 Tax=Micromonospora taraxaci TaxID=1316803 RepID=UPI0033E77F4A